MMRALALFVCLLLSATPGGGQTPSRRCAFDVKFDRATSYVLPSGQRNVFFGGNVVARCPSQNQVLKSDSLESYGDEGRSFFIGHVNYSDPRLKLTSDFLTYFQKEERLLAFGTVNTRLPSGSTLVGSQLEFFRAIPRVRQQHGVSIGRPTITLVERDAQGKAQPPVTVTGNTIWLVSDSVVSSQGEVVVVRPELTATADSLYLDGGKGLLRLMRTPKVRGTKGRPFTLAGQEIDLLSRRRKLERVLAKGAAEAVSEDLNIKADSLDLRIADDLLQRAVAWGKSRARATSPSQTITGDSIDVLMPGQRVRELHALRKARAEGMPDTTKFRTTERDRIMADTIVAYFDSIPARDTVSKPRINRLIARAGPSTTVEDYATALSQFPPQDTTLRVPAISYVRGRLIEVTFDAGAVKRVDVTPKESGGIYSEPNADTTSRRALPAAAAPVSPPSAAPAGARPAAAPARSGSPAAPPPSTPPVNTPVSTPVTPQKRP